MGSLKQHMLQFLSLFWYLGLLWKILSIYKSGKSTVVNPCFNITQLQQWSPHSHLVSPSCFICILIHTYTILMDGHFRSWVLCQRESVDLVQIFCIPRYHTVFVTVNDILFIMFPKCNYFIAGIGKWYWFLKVDLVFGNHIELPYLLILFIFLCDMVSICFTF